MSKRSRRERREHQQERALASGDLSTIRQMIERTPSGAVAATVRALGSPPADPAHAAELDALALRLAKQLRRGGDPAAALALAAAGKRRTPAFRMEEALSAFAAARDEIAAAVAAADAEVAAALTPMLLAVRGEVAPSAAHLPRDAARPSPSLSALHAVARAVGHAVSGAPAQAKAIIQRIPVPARASVLADEILAASHIAAPGQARSGFQELAGAARVMKSAEARRALVTEAAVEAIDLSRLPAPLAAEPLLRRRALRARLATAPTVGTTVEIIREVGFDAFDEPQRGAAALYHGFALLRTDPVGASRSLDRAIQLGADLVEALRGKVLAATAHAHGFPDDSDEFKRNAREAASAGDRLARALERIPLAGPLAAVAGKQAAETWLHMDEPRAALSSIARARPFATGSLVDELDIMEADATAFRSPREGERRVDALLARSPGNVSAWRLKMSLAVTQGDLERAERILVQAAEATKDPELLAEARERAGKKRRIEPFEGLTPGTASAGTLARELVRATTEEVDPYPLAAACREALAPGPRLAFDAAAITVAAVQGSVAMADTRLREAMRTWQSSPRDLARIVAIAVLADLTDKVPVIAKQLDLEPHAMRAVSEALAVASEGDLIRPLLPRFSANLTRAEVSFFKSVAAGRQGVVIAGVPNPIEAAREIDLALAPEITIDECLGPEDDDDEGPGILEAAEMFKLLQDLLNRVETDPASLGGMSPHDVGRLEQQAIRITSQPPTPARIRELMDLFEDAGLMPPERTSRKAR